MSSSEEKNYLRIGKSSDLKNKKDRRIYRALEVFPGILSWTTLILATALSFFEPFLMALFIISFDLFWLFRAIYLVFHLRSSIKRMREHEKTNWLKKLEQLKIENWKLKIENWKDIYHLIILPNYKEPLEIIKESVESILKSDYPKDRIIVVAAFEERAGEERKTVAKALEEEFGDKFFGFLNTFHPADITGEIAGKGSNETWAGKEAKRRIIDPMKIPYENVIVSSFDADTVVFPKYFSCLTYHYITNDDPTKTSFQPIPLYVNNIWQAPIFSQAFSFSATFWQMMCQERPEKLITFSSHSMSLKPLIDIGWWQTNIISEDSRIFWQCFLYYDGNYRVQPLFYPVSMDSNVAENFSKTMINIYKQQQRWAYGVENIFYSLFGFLKNKKISLKKKFFLAFELIEGQWSWATSPILIFFLGWLPILLGGEKFSQTLISFSLPRITSWILTFSMIGLLASVFYGISLFPKEAPGRSSLKGFTFALGCLAVPFVMIFFSSVPALDSQTRWMIGRYMGFWVTPKTRKS